MLLHILCYCSTLLILSVRHPLARLVFRQYRAAIDQGLQNPYDLTESRPLIRREPRAAIDQVADLRAPRDVVEDALFASLDGSDERTVEARLLVARDVREGRLLGVYLGDYNAERVCVDAPCFARPRVSRTEVHASDSAGYRDKTHSS